MFNKKASLEISIQAIVIVVLAMTLLGLGLGFIKGMFGNITDISKATFDKISDQLNRDLVNGNEKLVFSQTKINIERGKSVLLGWGIKNDRTGTLYYDAYFNAKSCPDTHGNSGICTLNDAKIVNAWFTYKRQASSVVSYFVDPASQKVERVDLSIRQDSIIPVLTGLYLIELQIVDNSGAVYATTDLFVTVT